MFAHIVGVPVEETALSLAPVAATVATAAGVKLRNRVHELVVQKKTRDEISKIMRSEFHWADLHVMLSLDGAIAEMQ